MRHARRRRRMKTIPLENFLGIQNYSDRRSFRKTNVRGCFQGDAFSYWTLNLSFQETLQSSSLASRKIYSKERRRLICEDGFIASDQRGVFQK